MENYLARALILIIEVIFSSYIAILALRFLLQWVRANFYNPLTQVIVKLTNPLLLPLRRKIRGLAGLDMASLILMLILQMVELILIVLLKTYQLPNLLGILILASAHLIALMVYVFFFAILIEVIFSWVALASGSPYANNPLMELVHALTRPLIRPVQDYIPLLGGMIDVSPLVVVLILQLTLILLVSPLNDLGLWLL